MLDSRHPALVCVGVVGAFFSTSPPAAFFTSFGLSIVAEVGVKVVAAMFCNVDNAAQSLPEAATKSKPTSPTVCNQVGRGGR